MSLYQNVYQENGFENRKEYLQFLADEYGVSLGDVLMIANTLGANEDFDGLVTSLQDFVEFNWE